MRVQQIMCPLVIASLAYPRLRRHRGARRGVVGPFVWGQPVPGASALVVERAVTASLRPRETHRHSRGWARGNPFYRFDPVDPSLWVPAVSLVKTRAAVDAIVSEVACQEVVARAAKDLIGQP